MAHINDVNRAREESTVERLTPSQITMLCQTEPGWTLSDSGKAIHTHIAFDSFIKAWIFMTEVAFAADAQNHHPEWSNIYSSVRITLTTHDADGLTDKDKRLAQAIQRAFTAHGKRLPDTTQTIVQETQDLAGYAIKKPTLPRGSS